MSGPVGQPIYDPYERLAGIAGSLITFPYILAPAPSGGDDYARIQSLVSVYNALDVEVLLRSGTYLTSAEIQPAPGFPLRLRGTGFVYQTSGGGGTTIRLTQAARSVVAVTEKYGYIQGVVLDANRLGLYGSFVQNGTSHRFIDGRSMNALLDGIHCSGTGLNQGLSTSYWSSDSNGKTYTSAGILSQYPNNAVRQAVVAGTAATISGNDTITFTGAPDLTTLGIRTGYSGDMIRVGATATTSFYGQILAVTPNTVKVHSSPTGFPALTISGQDYAIGIGFGWYTELSIENGFCILKDASLFRNNGCGGVFENSTYGDGITDCLADFNNFCGFALGLISNATLVNAPVITKPYCELNVGPDFVLGSVRDAEIHAPQGGSVFSTGFFSLGGQVVSSTYIITHEGAVESQLGVEQNFVVELRNLAGTIQHRIVAEHVVGNSAAQATRIIGNSLNWTNTPTVNNVTDFTNGVGLYDAGGVLEILLNVARPQSLNAAPSVTLEVNSTGTEYYALSTIAGTINVNGTTIARPAIWINDVNGNVPSINTVTLAAGKTIGIRVKGQFR